MRRSLLVLVLMLPVVAQAETFADEMAGLKGLYLTGRYDEMVPLLDALAARPDLSRQERVAVHELRAVALFLIKLYDEAKAEWLALLAVEPTHELDRRRFSPELLAFFARIRPPSPAAASPAAEPAPTPETKATPATPPETTPPAAPAPSPAETLAATPATQPDLTVHVEPVTRPAGLWRTLGWVAVASGGAMLVTSGVLLGVRFDTSARLDADIRAYNASTSRSPAEEQALYARRDGLGGYDVSALVLATTGVVAGVTGLVLLLLTGDERPPAPAAGLEALSLGPGYLGLSGSF